MIPLVPALLADSSLFALLAQQLIDLLGIERRMLPKIFGHVRIQNEKPS